MSFLIRKPYKLCSFKFTESLFLKVSLSFTLRDGIRDPGMCSVVEVINSSCAARIFPCHPDGGVLVDTCQVTQATQLSCPHPLDPDPEPEHTLLSDSENMCTHTSHTYRLAHITKKFQRQYFILLLMLLSALFLSLFFFFSIFRKSWLALNWLLVTVWKKKH